jgi:hypothetical protein
MGFLFRLNVLIAARASRRRDDRHFAGIRPRRLHSLIEIGGKGQITLFDWLSLLLRSPELPLLLAQEGAGLGTPLRGACATAVPMENKLRQAAMPACCITRVMHDNG